MQTERYSGCCIEFRLLAGEDREFKQPTESNLSFILKKFTKYLIGPHFMQRFSGVTKHFCTDGYKAL